MSEPVAKPPDGHECLTVREVAAYLRLNEKKVYELIKESALPATKAAGKWLFPRRLVEAWLLESAGGGAPTNRLLVAGSDDPLLANALAYLAADVGSAALVALSPTGTRLGLELLCARRADLCGMHWGSAPGSDAQHWRLVRAHAGHAQWTLVRMARREQGLLLSTRIAGRVSLDELATADFRWLLRQPGAGSQHFLRSTLHDRGLKVDALAVVGTALSERHAASLIVQGRADCAPGVRSAAAEFGLPFLPLGWESFDLVLPQRFYFRRLFQDLLALIGGERGRSIAAALQGYDLTPLGQLVSDPDCAASPS
jgi:putative molybdopterin biosynthesis protein